MLVVNAGAYALLLESGEGERAVTPGMSYYPEMFLGCYVVEEQTVALVEKEVGLREADSLYSEGGPSQS